MKDWCLSAEAGLVYLIHRGSSIDVGPTIQQQRGPGGAAFIILLLQLPKQWVPHSAPPFAGCALRSRPRKLSARALQSRHNPFSQSDAVGDFGVDWGIVDVVAVQAICAAPFRE